MTHVGHIVNAIDVPGDELGRFVQIRCKFVGCSVGVDVTLGGDDGAKLYGPQHTAACRPLCKL
jgi:hypothetical protein